MQYGFPMSAELQSRLDYETYSCQDSCHVQHLDACQGQARRVCRRCHTSSLKSSRSIRQLPGCSLTEEPEGPLERHAAVQNIHYNNERWVLQNFYMYRQEKCRRYTITSPKINGFSSEPRSATSHRASAPKVYHTVHRPSMIKPWIDSTQNHHCTYTSRHVHRHSRDNRQYVYILDSPADAAELTHSQPSRASSSTMNHPRAVEEPR